jgi:hypothetical protein
MGNLNESGTPLQFNGNIHVANDQDWYKVHLIEDESNPCIGSEQYTTTVNLNNIPAGRDYDLAYYFGSAAGSPTRFSNNVGSTSEQTVHNWSGSCSLPDEYDIWIRVYPFSPEPHPQNYTIQVIHDRTGP